MGKAAFSGPVYGAKANLVTLAFDAGAVSSGASTTLMPAASFKTPTYESWALTELFVNVSTCSSNAAAIYVKVECPAFQGNSSFSTTVFTINSGTSTSISSTFVLPVAPTAGEYEGVVLPPNSTIRFLSSGNSALGVTNLNVRGFTRFVNSTRPE